MWLLGMSTGCEEGDKHPVLVNSERSAQSVEIHCDGKLEDGLYRYLFTDFDAMQKHVEDSTRIGIAGKSNVRRFARRCRCLRGCASLEWWTQPRLPLAYLQ